MMRKSWVTSATVNFLNDETLLVPLWNLHEISETWKKRSLKVGWEEYVRVV